MSSKDDQANAFFNSDTISDEFFIEIIERKLNIARDKFKVRLVLITPAAGKNENYVSVVYRAKINVELLETKERKFVDVIIKAMITIIPEMEEFGVFPREKILYEDIIESLEDIWKERANEIVEFGPKCLKVTSKPYQTIVLDDLKAEGYEMLNRKIGVDVQQAKLVLSKLAKFHAASVIRYQKDGEIDKRLDRNFGVEAFFGDDSPYNESYPKLLNEIKTVISEFEGFEEISKTVNKWQPKKMMKSFLVPGTPMKCGLKVLNHGDDWLNNMMFKLNDDGSTESVKLIDYQISYWGSPIGDVFYFLMSSVKDEYKADHFDEFIEHYHSELADSLKKLKYDGHIPTLNELHIDLLEKRQYGASNLTDILFICKYDSQQELTIEQLMDPNAFDQEMFNRLYRNENYLKALKTWLPFLHKRGFLDATNDDEVKTE